ncbi:L-histidine N(alpha)-methyltransferase [Glycomyces tenuis]|uniref:L-histidine N(alpha)-methyltransferase n=1 Tax=Glycomyces tenuis TaxID=58116 RepID=UPI000428A7A5|nr:L-histidine N(alpha)-methyltransferase [Glycomyces tenuis]
MAEPELRVCLDEDDLDAALRFEARYGLTSSPKRLPMRLHYDGRGAALFGELTRQPEYYPTRCERRILDSHADAIADVLATEFGTGGFESPMGAPVSVIELGAGAAEKIRVVLDALHRDGLLASFWPFDVDAGSVRDVLAELAPAYPDARLGGIVGDFTIHLRHLPEDHHNRLVAFLGGTFGNFTGPEREQFLRDLREALHPGDWFMLGADLVKDPDTILAAYNDAAGVTAEFNRNVLHVLNHRLGADFEPEHFEHVATWDGDAQTVELRLRALKPMAVALPAIGLDVAFDTGEEIHTGISVKFRPAELEDQLRAADFRPEHRWSDPDGAFAVFLARVG